MPSQEKFDPTFRFKWVNALQTNPKMTSINMGQRFVPSLIDSKT